jgi:hypothetical protein
LLARGPRLLAPRLHSFPACGAGDLVRVEGHVLALARTRCTRVSFDRKTPRKGLSLPVPLQKNTEISPLFKCDSSTRAFYGLKDGKRSLGGMGLRKTANGPWAEWGSGKRRKPITQNALARLLRPHKVSPVDVGPEHARRKGYKRAQFEHLFRSLPRPTSSAP